MIALSIVIVSHLFLLWLWVQLSPEVRARAEPFDRLHQTIVYWPSTPQDVIEVQLLPEISHKLIASLKAIGSAKLAEKKSHRLTKEVIRKAQNDHSADSFDRMRTKVDAISTAESVGESSRPVVITAADTPPVAPAGAGFIPLTPTQRSLFDSPIAMRRQLRQRSLVEVVNHQLNPEGPKDRLKQGIQDAALPVCLASNEAGGILSPIAIAYSALRGKCKLP